MEKEQEQENKKKQNFRKEVRSWIVCIAATLAITLFITNFVIVNASIPSGSMENTIMTGDKLIAFRTAYLFSEPERGDVIIFEYPDDESEWYIKRVIALPGETIEVKDGKVYINGSKKPLKEPILKRSQWTISDRIKCRRTDTLSWETIGTVPMMPENGRLTM